MEWLQFIGYMLLIAGLIFLLFYVLKKVNGRNAVTSGNKLRVIDRAILGKDASVAVVCVAGKLLLLGISHQRIELLQELDMTEEEYRKTGVTNAAGAFPGFAEVLAGAVGIRLKKKPAPEEVDRFDRAGEHEANAATERLDRAEANAAGEAEQHQNSLDEAEGAHPGAKKMKSRHTPVTGADEAADEADYSPREESPQAGTED